MVVGIGLCMAGSTVWAQTGARTSATTQPTASSAAESAPRWNELSASQRQALKPLASTWSSLTTAHKRKWIALSRNFHKLPANEQRKLNERMGEWSTLTASERSQARLNFVATGKLSTDDKQAKWQAYQALSEDERHKLAEQAPHRPMLGAAIAVRPVPTERLTRLPAKTDNAAMPRISAAPHQIDPRTLLPQVDRHAAEHGTPAR